MRKTKSGRKGREKEETKRKEKRRRTGRGKGEEKERKRKKTRNIWKYQVFTIEKMRGAWWTWSIASFVGLSRIFCGSF